MMTNKKTIETKLWETPEKGKKNRTTMGHGHVKLTVAALPPPAVVENQSLTSGPPTSTAPQVILVDVAPLKYLQVVF